MTDAISRSAVLQEARILESFNPGGWHDDIYVVDVDIINELPSLDVVAVVRCKDCSNHGDCIFEDSFLRVGIKDGYCCVGGRKKDAAD